MFPDTDALISGDENVPLAVLSADCVPLYLFDPERRVIGIVHAGRAGTLADVAGETIRRLTSDFRVEPKHVHALIGPSAGPGAYEVSAEIADEFRSAGLPTSGRLLDLWESNARQLEASGVPRSQIAIARVCTITDGRFHSHRRQADGRRNMALIML
jgi:hypothetical protein